MKRAAAAVAAMALGSGLLTALAPPATAATQFGHDVSWPQCSAALGGYDLPMPPASTQFVIVGLTKGLPFTENPCLSSQVQWTRTYSKPAHGYAMAAYPTVAQLSAYGAAGPWSSDTKSGRLSNVGYAAAQYAVSSMQRIGFAPPMVWIDVEPRSNQPWPTGSAFRERENRLVIEGLMRGLQDAGFAYGVYSYAAGWQQITGGWWIPGVPVWATAGTLNYPTEALDRCTQPSFSGGRVLISQWYDSTRDYDRTCEPYVFGAVPIAPAVLSASTGDFNGDWRPDVLARVAATGDLRLYSGDGRGGWSASEKVGNGWQGMNALETPGDFNGDGSQDVLARETATGYLWLYRGNGKGGWLPRLRVGNGWGVMDAIVGPGDFNGDQRVDVLARESATGLLWLYPGNGRGGWLPRVRVGQGWGGMSALVGPGDFNGDGAVDLVARQASNGRLWLYPGDGRGGWLRAVAYGTGWNGMSSIMSPGDFNGDRAPDLLAVEAATGLMYLYPGDGLGGWKSRTTVGQGWGSINALL